MITAVIIDDEQNNIDNLKALLQKHCTNITIVASALNAHDGKEIILQQKPDLVFLDIQMPVTSGFDLLKSFSSFLFEIIFVTAYDQYALQAIKFSAVDYILKPIKVNDLKNAVEKAMERIAAKKQNKHLENLLSLLQNQFRKEEHRITCFKRNQVYTYRFHHPMPVCK